MLNLILTDFDGTLFPKSGGELSGEFINKIINLTEKGCYFAVNSGRPYSTLKKLLAPIQNRTLFVCNDGAQIMYKNCLLYKNTIPTAVAKEICGAVNSNELSPFASLRERNTPVTADILASPGMFGEDIYKLVFVKNNPSAGAVETAKKLATAHSLRVCFEDSEYLEFCKADADKGVATDFLIKKFGISGDILAFGDTKADFEMFKRASRVYLMSHATHLSYQGAKIIENTQEFIVNEM